MLGVETLWTCISSLHLGCGFKSEYVELLTKRVELMRDREKLCALTFDGMALKSRLRYYILRLMIRLMGSWIRVNLEKGHEMLSSKPYNLWFVDCCLSGSSHLATSLVLMP
jgi:Transposase protein